ncbi:MAG: hypothetical protein CFE38_13295 [Comamonadaceae bacterium PBBC1]|nr:MAG: hypothetical protein CFE38_13295 [Comamonadaceae bacterium PBBC1]
MVEHMKKEAAHPRPNAGMRRARQSLVLWGLCSSLTTWAQTGAVSGPPEITGSAIVHKAYAPVLPVQVFTRDELKMRGHASLTDAVQSLASVFNGVDASQAGTSWGGLTSAALHGVPSGTLVLLNGKRLAPHGLQTMTGTAAQSVDLGMLPLSAVERIEVLGDGASSVYGADAMAGVINIITTAQGKGKSLDVAVQQIQPKGRAGQGWVTSLNWTRGLLRKDGYSLRLTVEADKFEALAGRDRPNATQARIDLGHGGATYQVDSPKLSAFGSPVLMYSPTGQQKMYSPLYANGACVGNAVKYEGFEGGCKTNLLPTYDIYPESQSQKLHAFGEFVLPNAATVYTELLVGQQTQQMASRDWSGVSGKIADTIGAPGYLEAVLNGLNAEETYTYWRPDLPALRQKFNKTLVRAALGLKGEFQGWNYHASVFQTQSKATQSYEKDNLASLGILDQHTSLPNALMLKNLDAQNPLTAQLLSTRYWLQEATGSATLSAAELRASRSVFRMNGKEALLAWGLEGLQEKAGTQWSDTSGQPGFDGQRSIMAAQGELQVPVWRDVDVLASVRADQYSDVGAATSAKLAARWTINRRWAMRGAAGTGFAAPTLAQVQHLERDFLQSTVQLTQCSDALNTVAAGLKAADGYSVACRSNTPVSVMVNGNPDLRHQQTKQATWGLTYTPRRNVNVSADYWRVQAQDTLQFESVAAVLADPLRHTSAIVVNPALVSGEAGAAKSHDIAFLLKMKNQGQTVKEGIDIQARYREPTRDGRWLMGMQATFMLRSKSRISRDTAWVSDLAAYSAVSEVVTPRWRSRWMLGFEEDKMQWQLNINHTSGHVDKEVQALNTVTGLSETVSGRSVKGFLTADLLSSFQASRRTQIHMGVTNLTDSKPPLSFYALSNAVWGVNTQYGQLWGRTVKVGVTVKF